MDIAHDRASHDGAWRTNRRPSHDSASTAARDDATRDDATRTIENSIRKFASEAEKAAAGARET
jgi:hypothetical protein